jgi:hypothetical protein
MDSLAMRYDGNNPTGWSHIWCAHYLNMVLLEAGYPRGGNLAREYASYGQPTPARVGAIAVIPTTSVSWASSGTTTSYSSAETTAGVAATLPSVSAVTR